MSKLRAATAGKCFFLSALCDSPDRKKDGKSTKTMEKESGGRCDPFADRGCHRHSLFHISQTKEV